MSELKKLFIDTLKGDAVDIMLGFLLWGCVFCIVGILFFAAYAFQMGIG